MEISNILRIVEEHQPTIFGLKDYRKYAVLLPLVELNSEIHVLFEVRSEDLRSQPGDICFPGGRIDEDDDNPKHSAIRETSEELGIPKQQIKDILPLDYLVSDIGRIIYPFVGKIIDPNKIKPNKDEVAETFTVPLSYLLDYQPKKYQVEFHAIPEVDFPFHLIANGKNYNWRSYQEQEPFYIYKDKVIWGLTAKILMHFISILIKNRHDLK